MMITLTPTKNINKNAPKHKQRNQHDDNDNDDNGFQVLRGWCYRSDETLSYLGGSNHRIVEQEMGSLIRCS